MRRQTFRSEKGLCPTAKALGRRAIIRLDNAVQTAGEKLRCYAETLAGPHSVALAYLLLKRTADNKINRRADY